MAALYIASVQPGAGKSALAAALGAQLQKKGKNVGYLKPLCLAPSPDGDALFLKEALALSEPADALCAQTMSADELKAALSSNKDGWSQKVLSAFNAVSAGKDVVLLEGLSGLEAGSPQAQASAAIVKLLKAKAIAVVRYNAKLTAAGLAAQAQSLGEGLLGVVINAVPSAKKASLSASFVPELEKKGGKVLGILPQERALFTTTIGELAQHLQGQILNNPEASDELVENVMVGALSLDPAPYYMGKKTNKAVITRGDRPDLILGALQTSTRCLVLTGNKTPTGRAQAEAQEKGVPMILVKHDTPSVMTAVEELLGQVRFRQPKKLDIMQKLLEQNLNLPTLFAGLGIAG